MSIIGDAVNWLKKRKEDAARFIGGVGRAIGGAVGAVGNALKGGIGFAGNQIRGALGTPARIAAPVFRGGAPGENFVQGAQRTAGNIGETFASFAPRAVDAAVRTNPIASHVATVGNMQRIVPQPIQSKVTSTVAKGLGKVGEASVRVNPVTAVPQAIAEQTNKVFAKQGVEQRVPTPYQFGQGVLQAAAQAPVRAVAEVTGKPVVPKSDIAKGFLGDRPVSSYSSYARETADILGKGTGEKIPGPAQLPLGVGLAAMDIYPGGGGKTKLAKSLAGIDDVAIVSQTLKRLGLADDVIKDAAPKISKSKDPEEVNKVLNGAGVRNVAESGGRIRPRTTTAEIAAGKPFTLTPETGTNPLQGKGGDPNLLRNVQRDLDQGKQVTVEPTFATKVDQPSELQRVFGRKEDVLGKTSDPGFRVVKSEPFKTPMMTKGPNTEKSMGQEALTAQTTRAEEAAGRYNQPVLEKARKGVLREGYDPYADLQRLDNLEAKRQGKKQDFYSKGGLNPEESLTYLKGLIDNPKNEVETIAKEKTSTGLSIDDLIRQKGDRPEEGELFAYANALFDREHRAIHGTPIDQGVDNNQLNSIIKAYEAKNPNAAKEAKTLKEMGDKILDYGVAKRVIDKEEAELAKKTYKNYVPIERVMAEDTPTISVAGGIRNSVGRQKFLQKLQSSDKPLNTSFTTVLDRIEMAVKQGRTNDFDRELLRRQKAGTLPNSRLLADPADTGAKKRLTEIHRKLVAEMKKERTKLRTAKTNKRVAAAQLKGSEPGLANAAKQELLRVVPKDDLAYGAIKSMNREDLLATYDSVLFDATPGKVRMKDKYLYTKQQVAKNQNTIDAIKARLGELDTKREDALETRAGLEIDKGTGMAVIRGQEDGNPFAIEIPIDLAEGLARTSPGGVADFVARGGQSAANVFKILYTGALAPIFTLVNAGIKNPALMLFNAKGLTPFGIRAIGQGLASISKNSKFQREVLMKYGANRVNSTMSQTDQKLLTSVMASRGGVANYARFVTKHPVLAGKDAFKQLNFLSALVDNMQRSQVGAGLYYNLIRRGVPEAEAGRRAAVAYNEVFGNFQRVTDAARSAEPLILYSGALQAGARAIGRAAKTRPIESLVKASALAGGATLVTSSALGSDEGKAYFDDMVKTGKQYVLDGNLIFVLPGASKNPETGEWDGVYKLPIAPDFRPINRAIWQTMHNEKGFDPVLAAKGIFGVLTGDIANSLVDPKAGFLGGNPIVQTAKTLVGVDPRTNKPLVNEFEASRPKEEQGRDWKSTSEAAKQVSDFLGNVISPIQASKILGQGGYLGQVIQGKGDPVEGLKKQFKGGFGESDTRAFRNQLEEAAKGIKDEKDYRLFQSFYAGKDDGRGNIYDNSIRATALYDSLLKGDKSLFNAVERMNQENEKSGKPADPLFAERYRGTMEQLQQLFYEAIKPARDVGQAYDKSGRSAYAALDRGRPEMQKLIGERDEFFKSVSDSPDETKKTLTGNAAPEYGKSTPGEYYDYLNKERGVVGLAPVGGRGSGGKGGGRRRGRGGGSKKIRMKKGKFSSRRPTVSVRKAKAIKKVSMKRSSPKFVGIKRQKIS